jgi:hypothetical protein
MTFRCNPKGSFSRIAPACLLLFVFLLFCIEAFAGNPLEASKNKHSAGSKATPSSPENAPTEVVKIIDPDNGPGTDYTSLDAFAQNEERDLVSANEIAVALCRSSNGSADGPAQFYNFVTDAEHYVKVVADTGHRATAEWDDSKYRIIEYTTINSECIDIEIDNIIIDGIQMRLTGSGRNNDVLDPEVGDNFIIKNCFVWLDLSSGAGSGIDPKSGVEIYNCIFKGSTGSGILAKPGANVKAYNNTFIGWVNAIDTEGTVKVVNNISRGASGVAYATSNGGTFTSDSDYNSAENSGEAIVNPPRNNTQSPWYSGATPNSDIFINAPNNDFHLKPAAIFVDVGIGPAADPDVPLFDIEEDPRSGLATDLGADATNSDTISVNLKVFLQGPYNAGLMTTRLSDDNLLPLSQSYSGTPWNYNGTENVAGIPSDVVDWALVELRIDTTASSKFATRAAFVKNDGSIVDMDGISPVNFVIKAGNYYIVLHHRNHLSIMSSVSHSLDEYSALYDFTISSAQAYGANPMKELSPGIWGMISGDGNADGSVDEFDRSLVWRAQNGTAWDYTKPGDFNLDAGIDVSDLNLHWRINNGSNTAVP